MKLIGSNTSPYVRKVRIVMAEKKLDYQFVEEDVWAESTNISESNPLGKVPCLVMEDGGLLDASILARLEATWSGRTDAQRSQAWIDRQTGRIHATLKAMSTGLADKPFCSGIHFSLSDVAVGCALGYLDLRFPSIAWRENYANLARLQEKLMLRASFSETIAG
jgi:glutathione S-transferase